MPASISTIGLTMLRTRGRCVLGEIDGNAQPERDRHEHRDPRDEQRADHERADVEQPSSREPADVAQPRQPTLLVGELGDEVPGVDDEREDDQHGDEKRRPRTGAEHPAGGGVLAAPPRVGREIELGRHDRFDVYDRERDDRSSAVTPLAVHGGLVSPAGFRWCGLPTSPGSRPGPRAPAERTAPARRPSRASW